jgi:hypothetical protein
MTNVGRIVAKELDRSLRVDLAWMSLALLPFRHHLFHG